MIQHLLCIKVSTIKEYQAILTIGHLFIFNILHRILYVLSFITYIIAGFIHNPVVPLIIGIVLMTLTIILIKYIVNQKQSNS